MDIVPEQLRPEGQINGIINEEQISTKAESSSLQEIESRRSFMKIVIENPGVDELVFWERRSNQDPEKDP